jgi:uncharacterized membrane protein (UPF0127 family)
MAWLLCEGRVLASLEVARSRSQRLRGLIGRDSIQGALLIEKARQVHTFGMRFAIDVAFCDKNLVVIRTVKMSPNRISRIVLRSRYVIEAEAGCFERWELHPGQQLEVKE